MQECTQDADCPRALVCYETAGQNQSFCWCSAWYGLTNQNDSALDCSIGSESAQGMFWIISSILLMLWSIFLLGWFIRNLIRLERAHFQRTHPTIITLVQAIFGTAFMLLLFIITIREQYLGTTSYMLQGNGDKAVALQTLMYVFLSFGITLTSCSSVSIALTWLDVAHRTGKTVSRGSFGKLLKPIVAFEITFLFFIIIPLSIGYAPYATFVALPFVMIISLTYAFGFSSLEKVIRASMDANKNNHGNSATNAQQRFVEVIKETRLIARLVVIIAFIELILGVVLGVSIVQDSWKNYYSDPKTKTEVMFLTIAYVGIFALVLALLTVIGYNLNSVTNRVVRRHYLSNEDGSSSKNKMETGMKKNQVANTADGDGGVGRSSQLQIQPNTAGSDSNTAPHQEKNSV